MKTSFTNKGHPERTILDKYRSLLEKIFSPRKLIHIARKFSIYFIATYYSAESTICIKNMVRRLSELYPHISFKAVLKTTVN